MIRIAVLLACLFAFLSTPAQAKRERLYDPHDLSGHAQVRAPESVPQERRSSSARHRHAGVRAQGTVVGGRPAGCPHRFCGCAASIKLFGRIRPELNLAANWLRKFPRTSPAPLMAAARAGHVMVLLEHAGGDQWKVYDGNSGGGRIRIHVRSIRGFAVVNPHAMASYPRPHGRLASLPPLTPLGL